MNIDTLRSWLKAAGAPSPGQSDPQNREARRMREMKTQIRGHTLETMEDKSAVLRRKVQEPVWMGYAECWEPPGVAIMRESSEAGVSKHIQNDQLKRSMY